MSSAWDRPVFRSALPAVLLSVLLLALGLFGSVTRARAATGAGDSFFKRRAAATSTPSWRGGNRQRTARSSPARIVCRRPWSTLPVQRANGCAAERDPELQNGGGAVSYRVHFGIAPNPSGTVVVQDTHYTRRNFLSDTTYYWSVDALDSTGLDPPWGRLGRLQRSPAGQTRSEK